MAKIDCSECRYFYRGGCSHSFRYAAGAAGQEIDACSDVFFCRDFDKIELQEDTDLSPE